MSLYKATLLTASLLTPLASALSLPPLIHTIPGVTESLTSNAPPPPSLQIPTPSLGSPPFEASNIKPKKIGYFWTASGDNEHEDDLPIDIVASSSRVWDLHSAPHQAVSLKLTQSSTLFTNSPRTWMGGGIQDIKFILSNAKTAALATAVHLGQVWIIYPFRKDGNGKQEWRSYCMVWGPKLATRPLSNHIAALDISDLNNMKRLDDPDEGQPTIGPHYIVVFDLTNSENPLYY
ncbi:hypothetical protein GGR53DRAFT_466889 [Hypoxylon sp. FL1150]|nr:hypothetical protein GGR53DRAFT_466889 [Hypoxylon sp. FL1150]